MRAKDRGRADFAGKGFGLKDAALNARRTQLLPGTGRASGNHSGMFPAPSGTLSPPFAAPKDSERGASGHRPINSGANVPSSAPLRLSPALCAFPRFFSQVFRLRAKRAPPGRRFLQADFPHTGGFSRANAERRKRAEGSLLPPFRVCHCQTADAARSTRVLWIISPERPLPPPLQRLR